MQTAAGITSKLKIHNFTGYDGVSTYTKTGLNASYLNDTWVSEISFIGNQSEIYDVKCVAGPVMKTSDDCSPMKTANCTFNSYPIADLCK